MPPRRRAANVNNQQEHEIDPDIQRLHDLSANTFSDASEFNRTLSNVMENFNRQLQINTQAINNMQNQLNDMQNQFNDSMRALRDEIHNMNP